jgi:hypothetical protein
MAFNKLRALASISHLTLKFIPQTLPVSISDVAASGTFGACMSVADLIGDGILCFFCDSLRFS